MTVNEILALTVITLISLGLVGLSIPMLMGKCAGIISGYSTLTPEEKSQWDAPALAKFVGKFLLATGLITLFYGVGLICFDLGWLTWIYLPVTAGLSIFVAIHCNTKKRFRK